MVRDVAWAAVAGLFIGFCASSARADNVALGREIFRGLSSSPAQVKQGELSLRLSQAGCDRCHGRDGLGAREGGVAAPPIVWPALMRGTAGRPAYSRQSLALALSTGIDSRGRTLNQIMPRFALSDIEVESLLSYLADLPAEQRRGVGSDSVTFTIAVPSGKAEFGERIQTATRRALARLGDPTPHGRRVLFTVKETANVPLPCDCLAFAFTLLADQPALRATGNTPLVFPMLALAGDESHHDVRSHMPSREAQIRALFDAAPADATVIADEAMMTWVSNVPSARGREFHRLDDGVKSDVNSVVVLLSTQNDPRLTPLLRPGLKIFGLADSEGDWVERGAQLGAKITLTDTRLASRNGASSVEVSVDIGVRLIVMALLKAGRELTQSRFMTSFDTLVLESPDWAPLDYSRARLTGTTDVRMRSFGR